MGFLQNVRGHFQKVLSQVFQKKSYFTLIPPYEKGMPQPTDVNFETFAEEGYEQSELVYRCIREISNRVSSIRYFAYKLDAKGKKEEVTDRPLNDLINQPNPYQSWMDLLEHWAMFLNISGNSYMDISERKGRSPYELYMLRPERIEVIPGTEKDQKVKGYQYTISGLRYPNIPPEDLIHWKFAHPSNDYYGLSPIQVAANTIDTENEIEIWNKYRFQNFAHPSGILSTNDTLTEAQAQAMRLELQNNWQGASNAYRPVVMEGGLQWTQTQMTAQDADFVNLTEMNREDICIVFGVPALIAGVMEQMTYNNYKTAEKIFYQQTIIPHINKFVTLFNAILAPQIEEGILLGYDLSEVECLGEDRDLLNKRVVNNFRVGLMTQNEARQAIGLDEVKGGDIFVMPSNLLPIGSAEEAGGEKRIILPGEFKVIDLTSRAAKRKYIASFERRRRRFERKLSKVAKSIIYDHITAISGAINRADSWNDLQNVYNVDFFTVKNRWEAFHESLFESVMEDFGKSTMEQIKKETKISIEIIEYKVEDPYIFNPFDSAVTQYINGVVGELITQVNDTTIKAVRREILAGIEAGESIKEIAERINDLAEISSEYRSELIAATEVSQASNAGSFQASQQWSNNLGITGVKKTWLAVGDDRTRPTHIEADGQTVEMKEPFELSGGMLMFPGDTSMGASGSETIACRCCHSIDTSQAVYPNLKPIRI